MSNETFNKFLADLRKHLWRLFLLLLAISADSIAVIQFLQGHRDEFTTILFSVGTSSLWLFSFYVYFKKQAEISKISGDLVKQSFFPKWARLFALSGIIAIPLLAGGMLGWYYYKENRPSDKIVILVADFEGPDPKNYRVTETIVERLREATNKYTEVRVEALHQPITAQQGSDFARAKGKEYKASIVLWGWYGKTEEKALVTAHFEVLNSTPYLYLLREKETVNLTVEQLNSFEIQTRLSKEMTYLSLLTVGIARLQLEDYSGALSRFTSALSQSAVPEQMIDPTHIHMLRGAAYILQGNNNAAIAECNQAMRLNPNDAELYYRRGVAYEAKGDLDSAIVDFDKAIKLKPDFADVYHYRGITYENKNEYERAIVDYNQAIKLEPDLAEAYCNRGFTYFKMDDYNSAIIDYNDAIKLNPDYADAYARRGLAYRYKKQFDLAISDFNQAIKLQSNYAQAYANLGHVYSEKIIYDQAILNYNKAIELNPNLIKVYYYRGRVYTKQGNYDQAILDYSKVIEIKPNDADSYLQRAVAYAFKTNYERTIADLTQCIKLKPDDPSAYHMRALANASTGNINQAIPDFNMAIRLNPNDSTSYHYRQLAYELRSDIYELIRSNVYEGKSNLDSLILNLNQIFKFKPEIAFDKTISLNPTDSTTNQHHRQIVYQIRVNLDSIIFQLDNDVKLTPDNAEAYYNRGRVYKVIGEKDKAVEDFKKFIELTHNLEMRQEAIKLLQQLGVNISKK